MYLKKIELQGFKSFADKTTIDFEKGITGVVGPNGSGKSNISDAIKWVLGEQSAKSLRGSKMEDVIFSGTSKRKALGFSEVTLTLDNKNKEIPVDYSEVSITRRVYRSGESEYYINKTSSRLKDVKELFMDTGVGTDGYSIIGQGKIEEILSSKTEDRRNLIEEAVGIVKYKSRKKESEKKLDKTNDNLIRINDIIEELSTNIDSLKDQSDKANKYLQLKSKLKSLEVNLFVREINRLNDEVEHLKAQKELVLNQYSDNEENRKQIEIKFEKSKSLIEEIDNEIENIQNQKQTLQRNIEKEETDFKIKKEKISFLNKDIVRLDLELEENIELTDEKQDELLDLEKEKENINTDISSLKLKSDEINRLLNQNESYIKFSEENIEKKKTDIIDILNNITEKRGKINTIESFIKNIDKRIKGILEEKEELDRKKDSIITENDNIGSELNICTKKIKNLEIEKNKLLIDREKSKRYMDEYIKHINDLKLKIDSNKSRLKMLNNIKERYDGYYKGVKNILLACKKNSSFSKGLKGVVAELITTQKKYEKAIEIALGGSLQNVITESKEDAKKFIDYLKNNKLGRVTFLPLDSIKGRRINNDMKKILSQDGVYDLASKLISYDEEYTNIFEYLLGRVIVVENLKVGIYVSRVCNNSYKIVTLEGDVINPGGSMTGGDYKNNSSTSLIGRDREIEELKNNIKSNEKKYNEIIQKYSDLKKQIHKEEEKLENLNESINNLKIDINSKKNRQDNLKEQRDEIEYRIERFSKELNNLELEKENSINRIMETKKTIKELESKNSFTKQGVEIDLKDFNDKKEKVKKLNDDITKLKVELASFEQRQKEVSNTLKRLNLDIDSLKTKNETIKKEIKTKEHDIKDTEKLLDDIDKKRIELKEKLNKSNSILVESKNQKKLYLDNFYKEQETLKKMNENISSLQKSINKIDVKMTKCETSLENFNNKLWEEYELTYQMALEYKKEIQNVTEVQKEIKNYKIMIKKLGNINMDSIEQYKEISERYEFLNTQKEDLKEAKVNLEKVIRDMEDKMKEVFVEKFKVINRNFKSIFEKLFGGGKADIYLVNEDNILESDIEIIAQPPGKKLQNINLLSGGEKSLTAISLLFAILKLKPTPFCVLDEIEAALDDANVIRFSEYLREFSEKTQFIVITHRKGTMESVDSLYGVTMEEHGISRLLSVKLSELLEEKAS